MATQTIRNAVISVLHPVCTCFSSVNGLQRLDVCDVDVLREEEEKVRKGDGRAILSSVY